MKTAYEVTKRFYDRKISFNLDQRRTSNRSFFNDDTSPLTQILVDTMHSPITRSKFN